MLLPVAETYETLSAMITPAIFLTATGSLIVSTSNRMSRIVDRIRVVTDLGDRLSRGDLVIDFAQERMDRVSLELDRLVWRSDRIRYALILLYLAFSAFVTTSLVLALDAAMGNRILVIPTILAVVGVSLMLAAGVNLIREALEALRGNRDEVRFARDLHRKRRETPS